MWSVRRTIALMVAAFAVALVGLVIFDARGNGQAPAEVAPRTAVIRMANGMSEAEFNASGGELLSDDVDLYEKCAPPAECLCWLRPEPGAGAGQRHEPSLSALRDQATADLRGAATDAPPVMCRVTR